MGGKGPARQTSQGSPTGRLRGSEPLELFALVPCRAPLGRGRHPGEIVHATRRYFGDQARRRCLSQWETHAREAPETDATRRAI